MSGICPVCDKETYYSFESDKSKIRVGITGEAIASTDFDGISTRADTMCINDNSETGLIELHFHENS